MSCPGLRHLHEPVGRTWSMLAFPPLTGLFSTGDCAEVPASAIPKPPAPMGACLQSNASGTQLEMLRAATVGVFGVRVPCWGGGALLLGHWGPGSLQSDGCVKTVVDFPLAGPPRYRHLL